jgi:malonate transporter and related proteins
MPGGGDGRMTAILDIIVPVFGMVAVGWALGRTPLLTREGLRGLTNVTFYAFFPALLFRSMSRVRIEGLSFDILVVFFGAGLLLYALLMPLARAMGMRFGEQAIFALAGTFSNGVGIGIPFISYAFGEKGLVPLLMIISVNSLILLTLASFLMEMDGQRGGGGRFLRQLGGATLKMLKHPVIPPIFIGLLWAEITHLVPGLGTPVVIDRVLQGLAAAAPPCGLIMAGASLAHVGLKEHWQTAAVTTVFKLAVLPVLVWLSGRYLFTLDPLWLTVATLNAALPSGANVYLVAQLYRTGVGLATNAVVLSTGASIATLSIALLLLGVHPGG